MLSPFPILIALGLFPVIAAAQLPQQKIRSEAELAYAVYQASTDAKSREDLLRTHQQLVNSQLWAQLTGLAATAYHNRLPEQSLKTYEAAIEVATRLQDSRLLAKSYYNIGITFSGLNQFPKAIESYEKSREHFERAGSQQDLIYILADLGALYFILEDHEKARDHSERAIALAATLKVADVRLDVSSDVGQARALHTLAEIDLRDGNHLQAIERLQTSLSLYQQLNGKGWSYNTYIAGVYAAFGKVYPEIGDYARGLFYLNKALDIVRNQTNPSLIASLLNSVGYLYMEQEDYAQSKMNFDESVNIYRSMNNHREEARVLLNLGVVQQRQANYEGALRHFKDSFQAAKATQSIDVQIAAGEGIGVVLRAKKDFVGALEIFNSVLGIAKDHKNRTREIELLWRRAETHHELGNYGEAASDSESAVALAHAAHLPKLAYLATTTLGQVYAAQGKSDPAKQTLIDAVQILEKLRRQVAGQETASQLFFENKLTSYHALVELLIKQGNLLEALFCAERAKGRVLLDIVSGSRSDLTKLLTPDEKRERDRLNRRISEINLRIKTQDNSNGTTLSPLYSDLDAARLEYQAFQDAVYVRHPNLKTRSGQTATLSVADVNYLVKENDTAYLEYVVANDRVSLLVLTKDRSNDAPDLRFYPISIKPKDLRRKVNQFHDMLAERRPAYANAARELYALLIEPAKQQLRSANTICIIPDNFLWNLPFQALMSAKDRFLIEDHGLFYTSSLSVLREMHKKKVVSENTNSSLIAFGNPVIGRDEKRDADLCPLPEAETEVHSIAKSFAPRSSKVFIGRNASEKAFKALASSYSVIHLATHGVIDNRQPLYSHLLLTKTESDPENDGLLEAREIMNMDLKSDLAVLSACETANGRISPGEGVVGTSWAFFVAGTRSLLVSQWKVSSASTSRLMEIFHQDLHSSDDRPRALQNGAKELMQDARYHHPFYWAAFVLIGSN